MSIRDEAQLFNIIKTMLPGHWCRIENLAGVGNPDVNYAFIYNKKRAEGWTELKILRRSYDPDVPLRLHNIRKFQYSFWQARYRQFGNVSVTIGIQDSILVVPPHLFRELVEGRRPMGLYGGLIPRGPGGAAALAAAYTDPYSL
jgi:hypothetical protein